MLAITNAIIVMTDHYIYDGTVLVDNGRIVDFGRKIEIPEGAEMLDANGAYVGPGLIDVHTHSDGEIFFTEDPEKAANTLLMHGVTDVMPALYYNMNADQYVKAIDVLKKAITRVKFRSRATTSCLATTKTPRQPQRCLPRTVGSAQAT